MTRYAIVNVLLIYVTIRGDHYDGTTESEMQHKIERKESIEA